MAHTALEMAKQQVERELEAAALVLAAALAEERVKSNAHLSLRISV